MAVDRENPRAPIRHPGEALMADDFLNTQDFQRELFVSDTEAHQLFRRIVVRRMPVIGTAVQTVETRLHGLLHLRLSG